MGKETFSKQQNKEKGFESLLDVHTKALEENSKSVVEILELLSEKSGSLSCIDKNKLKRIKGELKTLDKKLDSLGDGKEPDEEWW